MTLSCSLYQCLAQPALIVALLKQSAILTMESLKKIAVLVTVTSFDLSCLDWLFAFVTTKRCLAWIDH